jgi:iron complex transport system substrate-binding protein
MAIDDPTYVFNLDIQSRAAADEIAMVGSGASADIEKLISLDPDVVMTNAYGSVYDSHPKMLEANLPVVINADYLEESPLGRAEWGKFIAAFYDQEDLAAVEFDRVKAAYNEAKALAESATEKVTVITNTDYQGTWYVPGGQSFAANLMKDAGANYLFADQEGSTLPLSFEVVFDKGKDADYWINVGFPTDKASLLALDTRYTEFKAYQTDRVYNNNARANANGGLDYFESGVANPDVVLKDLVKIFYPELLPNHTLYYYQLLK